MGTIALLRLFNHSMIPDPLLNEGFAMKFFLLLLSVLVLTACAAPPVVVDDTAQEETPLTQEDVEQAVLAREHQWMDRWAAGNPLSLLEYFTDDVTYFGDDIAAQTRLDGIEEVRNHITSLVGQVPPHTYELVDPKVQVYGDIAIVTLRYHINIDGEPAPPWKATNVYRLSNGDWKMVHANWSLVKER